MPFIQIENSVLPFILRRSSRTKRLQIVMKPLNFEVVAPKKITSSQALTFVWKQRYWMLKVWQKRKVISLESEFLPSESIPYRGMQLTLHVKYGLVSKVCCQDKALILFLPWEKIDLSSFSQVIKKHVQMWYQQQALHIIKSSIEKFCTSLKRWPKSYHIKLQKTRWGSCGINESIYLNWLLVLAPEGVLEYVVAHEVCHLFYRNHGKCFWKKVAECMPDYRQYEKWLSTHGHCLRFPT